MNCGSQRWIARHALLANEALFCAVTAYARGISEGSTAGVYSQGDSVTMPVCQRHSQTVVRLKKSHFIGLWFFSSALFTKETLANFS